MRRRRFKEISRIFVFSQLPAAEAVFNLEPTLDSRMLLSCLVDADYTVSALEKDPDYPRKAAAAHHWTRFRL